MEIFEFRQVTPEDVPLLASLEARCFSPAEGASLERIRDRVNEYADRFLIMLQNGNIVGMVNGLCSDNKDLTDEMYEDVKMHKDAGLWQMIFSVCVEPSLQGKGMGLLIVKKYIEEIKRHQFCKGIVLTCKEHLLHFYSKNGFVDEGVSVSEHGGVVWHQMRLTF